MHCAIAKRKRTSTTTTTKTRRRQKMEREIKKVPKDLWRDARKNSNRIKFYLFFFSAGSSFLACSLLARSTRDRKTFRFCFPLLRNGVTPRERNYTLSKSQRQTDLIWLRLRRAKAWHTSLSDPRIHTWCNRFHDTVRWCATQPWPFPVTQRDRQTGKQTERER